MYDYHHVRRLIQQSLQKLKEAPPELAECFDLGKLKKLSRSLRVRQQKFKVVKERRQRLERELLDWLIVVASVWQAERRTRQAPDWAKTRHRTTRQVLTKLFTVIKALPAPTLAKAAALAGRPTSYYLAIYRRWREYRDREQALPQEMSEQLKKARSLNKILQALVKY